MPTTTINLALRKPLATEAPDGAGQIGALADDVDAVLAGKGASFFVASNVAIPSGDSTLTLTNTDFNDDTNFYALSSGQVLVKKAGLYIVSWYLHAGASGVNGTIDTAILAPGGAAHRVSVQQSGDVRLSGSRVVRYAANTLVAQRLFAANSGNTAIGGLGESGLTIGRLSY